MDSREWLRSAVSEGVDDRLEGEPGTAPYLLRDEQTGVVVRAATRSDVPAMAAIGARAFWHAHAAVLDPVEIAGNVSLRFDLARLSREIARGRSHLLTAVWEGQPVGFAELRPAPLPPESRKRGQRPMELAGLYVAPDWIGNGVGSALLRASLQIAHEQDYDLLWVCAWTGNRPAVGFFENLGFTPWAEAELRLARGRSGSVVVLVRVVPE